MAKQKNNSVCFHYFQTDDNATPTELIYWTVQFRTKRGNGAPAVCALMSLYWTTYTGIAHDTEVLQHPPLWHAHQSWLLHCSLCCTMQSSLSSIYCTYTSRYLLSSSAVAWVRDILRSLNTWVHALGDVTWKHHYNTSPLMQHAFCLRLCRR